MSCSKKQTLPIFSFKKAFLLIILCSITCDSYLFSQRQAVINRLSLMDIPVQEQVEVFRAKENQNNKNLMLSINRPAMIQEPNALLQLYSFDTNASQDTPLTGIRIMRENKLGQGMIHYGRNGDWIIQAASPTRGKIFIQPKGGDIEIGKNSAHTDVFLSPVNNTVSTLNIFANTFMTGSFFLKPNASSDYIDVSQALSTVSSLSNELDTDAIKTFKIIP